MAESGFPGFENTGWFGFMAAAGMPQAVVDRIHRDTAAVLAQPDVVARLQAIGMAPVGNAPAALARAIDAESQVWADVVRSRRLKSN